jgi:DUF1016 N-terminal domain
LDQQIIDTSVYAYHYLFITTGKLRPLVAEIGWPHNMVIMEKCKDELEREFYAHLTRDL